MGKRSNFARKERDFYPTPYEAVIPLIPHLREMFLDLGHFNFIEPCAGDGILIDHLKDLGFTCWHARDIDPQKRGIAKGCALSLELSSTEKFPIITNPPWDRKILHPMIDHFRKLSPTWLLFDADWAHTKQSAPYMPYCHKIVSVGRLKWIPGSPHTGKDNCAWYLFKDQVAPTQFFGRV